MGIEIKRADGSIFVIDTEDITEIGEHETGGTYVCLLDGRTMLLDQDYKTVKGFLSQFGEVLPSGFTLMSAQKFKMLKKRVKRVKRHKII